ncbi:hypothetical protein EV361DRAFT_187118 [Lentinula raphanica]|nr:hypothetical protein FB446DRAFT_479910 [Lentinula raphanica]KAJ3971804.1 hypothetical protein EV361DRAFT_187118 [Lentinula raphanica]
MQCPHKPSTQNKEYGTSSASSLQILLLLLLLKNLARSFQIRCPRFPVFRSRSTWVEKIHGWGPQIQLWWTDQFSPFVADVKISRPNPSAHLIGVITISPPDIGRPKSSISDVDHRF